MSGKSTDYRHRQVKIEGQFSDGGDRAGAKPTSRSLKSLKVAQTLVAHGADVNRRDDHGRTPLHEACAHKRHQLVSFLLSCGADPLAKDNMICKPEIKPRHLRGITVHFEAALEADDKVVIENCLSAIEKCMPRRTAVSVLLEWAGLAVHHREAARRIHGIIEKNLPKGELSSFDPRYRLATYAIRYDCNEMREEALSELKQAGLAPKGMGRIFLSRAPIRRRSTGSWRSSWRAHGCAIRIRRWPTRWRSSSSCRRRRPGTGRRRRARSSRRPSPIWRRSSIKVRSR
jgi:Ankyrin repeats (many copies)